MTAPILPCGLDPLTCPRCGAHLGPHGCCRPTRPADPDAPQGWLAVYAGPDQGIAALYAGGPQWT